jgi:hypothetical protein
MPQDGIAGGQRQVHYQDCAPPSDTKAGKRPMLRKQAPPQAGLSLRQFPAIQITFDKTLLTANSRRSARAWP